MPRQSKPERRSVNALLQGDRKGLAERTLVSGAGGSARPYADERFDDRIQPDSAAAAA
jgi:hypothetical protein